MKNIPYIIIALFLGFSSCEFLEVDPTSQVPAEDVFTTEKGVMSALNGAYDNLQSAAIAQDVIVFGDLAADNLIHIGTKKEYRQISDQHIFTENAYIEGMWSSSYSGINKVNNILAGIDNVTGMSDQAINEVVAQCHFLRAFHYFNLVKYFGGVPMKTSPTKGQSPEELNIERVSADEIYNFVIRELTTADSLLDGTGIVSPVYADEGAVKAFLARTYLYRQNYIKALEMASSVIEMGYELVEGDNLQSLYDEESSNNEIIFEIDFANDDETNGMADWCLPEGRFEVAAWMDPSNTASIYEEYDESDLRRDVTVASTDINGSTDYYCAKYDNLDEDSDNIIIFRLAEMYLIAAEASNEIAYVADGNQFDYLNEVRTRAGLTEVDAADLTDQAAFRMAIERERRLELAFEGHRYFDLIRTGRADDVLQQLGPLTGENNYLFPIPRAEVDANEAISENNPGY